MKNGPSESDDFVLNDTGAAVAPVQIGAYTGVAIPGRPLTGPATANGAKGGKGSKLHHYG